LIHTSGDFASGHLFRPDRKRAPYGRRTIPIRYRRGIFPFRCSHPPGVERAASLAQRITRAPPVGRNGADAARRRAGTDGLCAAERDRPLPVAGLCSRRLSTSGGTRFSSSHRNKRGQRSQQNDRRKKLRRNMSHLRLLFHLISRLYERTSIRNVPLDPWRAGSFSRQSGSTRLSTKCVFLNKSRGREFIDFWLRRYPSSCGTKDIGLHGRAGSATTSRVGSISKLSACRVGFDDRSFRLSPPPHGCPPSLFSSHGPSEM